MSKHWERVGKPTKVNQGSQWSVSFQNTETKKKATFKVPVKGSVEGRPGDSLSEERIDLIAEFISEALKKLTDPNIPVPASRVRKIKRRRK